MICGGFSVSDVKTSAAAMVDRFLLFVTVIAISIILTIRLFLSNFWFLFFCVCAMTWHNEEEMAFVLKEIVLVVLILIVWWDVECVYTIARNKTIDMTCPIGFLEVQFQQQSWAPGNLADVVITMYVAKIVTEEER